MKILINLLSGLCLGSFLNVILLRKDWFRGRSHCDVCENTLKWYDLIPIISFLILRGKCRYCKTKIDKSHLISELLLGIGFVVVSVSCLSTLEKTIAYFMVLVLGINTISDMHERLTYTWVIYGGIAIVGLIKLFSYQYTLQGVLINSAIYIMFAAMCYLTSIVASRYIGAGDLDVIFLLFICSRIYSLILFFSLVITTVYMMLISRKVTEGETVAFVPYLYIGYLLSILAGGCLI